MDDPGGVNRGQAGDRAGRVGEAFGQRAERLVLLDEVAQRAAGGVLHREEPVAVGVTNVEDAGDIRVADRAAQPQLALEPLLPARIVRQPRLQHLDRHDGRRHAIERAQHDAAAALPEHRLDLIAPREQVSRLDLLRDLARHRRLVGHGGDAAFVLCFCF